MTANFQISQAAQSANIIESVRPYPVQAVPFQPFYGYGCGCACN